MESRDAANDAIEQVTNRLNNVVHYDHYQGVHPTPHNFQYPLFDLAVTAGRHSDVPRIHDLGQLPHDHSSRRSETHYPANLYANVDIAPHVAVPPVHDVVTRPDEGIDRVEKVVHDDPEDERAGCDVLLRKVPYHRWDAEEPCWEAEDGEKDCLRVERSNCRCPCAIVDFEGRPHNQIGVATRSL